MEDKTETRNSGINHLAFGSLISGWGILLLLQQVGIIGANVNTSPFAFTAFGVLLIATGIIKLKESRRLAIE
jgi:hypothetical protein